ncbi:fibronectin type III domain-containing protein [Catellatospora vulcania]|uniref:fibronectin type III domain-containing protein n=1 Tax=Catellatospora vulcania TaxID=1460450 RepID=UPI0012D455AB|nr:fibronectin type III domain-containing protein [Catellatospora vulcania]
MRSRTRFAAALTGAALLGTMTVTAWTVTSATASSAPPQSGAAPVAAVDGVARALGISADTARRELQAQEQAHRVAASLPAPLQAQSSGKWFDPQRGLVVAVTTEAAAAQVRAAGAQPHLVTRGPVELQRLAKSVRAVVGKGVPGIYGWGVDVQANVVSVNFNTARHTAATDTAVARLRALGSGVRLVHSDSQPRQQAGDIRTGSPWWPGTESNCSVGFAATDSTGGKHFLTAGHCTNNANQAAYGQSGQQNRIGTSNVGGTRSVNAREGDMGVVAVTEAGWNLSASVNTWDQPAVTITGSAEAMVGDRVCHSGNTSKWQCGVVKYTHKSVDYGGGLIIEDLTWTTACSLGGDSGGGWLLGDKAVGLHDGGPSSCVTNPTDDADLSIFQPVNEALAKWNLTLVTGSGGGDTAAPTAPGNPRATGATASSVSLAWDAATDNVGVTAYDVYRGATLATTVTGLTATVTGLTADTAYSFTVKARDAAGNVGPASAAVSARTQPGGGDTQPPTAPGNLRSTAQTSTSITLAWDAATDNVGVSAYDVYRGTTLATTVAGLTATVTGLTADTAYSFTVQARDAAGNKSSPTAALSVRTKPAGGGGRTFTSNTDYQIYDYNQFFSPVTSTATGPAATTVSLVVTINHTCAEDLGISLVAPNGNLYAVKYSGGYTCTPWSGPATFTVPSVSSPAGGVWKLRVTDYGPGDTGVLDSWSITL